MSFQQFLLPQKKKKWSIEFWEMKSETLHTGMCETNKTSTERFEKI
jgi:hypothetical protein